MALEDLDIYRLIVSASAESDSIVKTVTASRDYALADQLGRAALSVGNNFAEGYGRGATGERLMLLFYAEGSVQECKNCILCAVTRNHIDRDVGERVIRLYGRVSIGIIEFCASILASDPEYKGPYRAIVARRRAWRFRKK